MVLSGPQQVLASWDRRYRGTQGAALRALASALEKESAALPDRSRVLDLGTGTGLVLRTLGPRFNRAQLIGLDLHPAALEVAQTYLPPGACLLRADAHHWPIASGTLDLVVAKSASAYWSNPAQVIREIARCLKIGGGKCIFFEPNPAHPVVRLYRRFSIERAIFADLDSPGFEDFNDQAAYLEPLQLERLFKSEGVLRTRRSFALGGLFNLFMASS